MVQLRRTDECKSGNHDACNGGSKRPKTDEIVFGGWMCTCSCHHKKPTEIKEPVKEEYNGWVNRLKRWLIIFKFYWL